MPVAIQQTSRGNTDTFIYHINEILSVLTAKTTPLSQLPTDAATPTPLTLIVALCLSCLQDLMRSSFQYAHLHSGPPLSFPNTRKKPFENKDYSCGSVTLQCPYLVTVFNIALHEPPKIGDGMSAINRYNLVKKFARAASIISN